MNLCRDGARLGIQQTLNGIFRTRHAPDLFVTEILHWTTFQEFASCCSTIVQISLHKNGMDTGPVPMRESLESQIPDTAAYTEWLAIVCSIVVAALFCAVLFSNGALT